MVKVWILELELICEDRRTADRLKKLFYFCSNKDKKGVRFLGYGKNNAPLAFINYNFMCLSYYWW